MWELPNDRSDFARLQGAHADHTAKTGGIPDPRATNRASRVQTRKGTRDHVANLRWVMEKAREQQRDLYMCFIDYKKAFDYVDHERLWVVLRHMGVPEHLIVLLRKAVHQPGCYSQNGVWRDIQHRQWEMSASGMYPLTS